MQHFLPIMVLCALGTAVKAQSQTTATYDVELEMTALMTCEELSYEWENEAVGEMAETRIFLNEDGSCTFDARQTETFHMRCLFDEAQRVNYATEILRQARAETVQTRNILEDGKFIATYTIDGGEEVYRSYVTEALNDGTCETFSTDPESPLYKALEE